jgi:hypothetical protein
MADRRVRFDDPAAAEPAGASSAASRAVAGAGTSGAAAPSHAAPVSSPKRETLIPFANCCVNVNRSEFAGIGCARSSST